ncbi:MFS transporter [Promicromonospora sukumoe]|uniref:MFS transporter n=1 Tax=Promicromonospora sukumoe TaxID=88382 RepID=UPI00036F08EB|nr:MFS transporter [Promicromonospora sukumoe]
MFDLPELRRHVPLAVALGVDSVGTGISGPLLLLFLTRVADIPLARAGLTLSATFAVALVVPALVGQVVARLGGRNILIAAQVLQAVGLTGLLVARDLPAVAACTLVAAIGQRAFWSSVFAVIADASDSGPAEDKDRWFAFTNMVQNTGYALGALAAGALLLLPGDLPYLLAIGTNAACFAVSALLLLVDRSGRRVQATDADAPVRAHRLPTLPYLGLIGVAALFAFCSTVLGSGLGIYVVDGLSAPAALVGPLLAINTILSALGQAPAVRLTRRRSRVAVMVTAGIIWSVWGLYTAALGLAPAWLIVPGLVLSVLVYSVAELLHGPRSIAYAADAAPPGQRSTYLSWFQYSFALANIAAPGVFAATFSVDPALPWVVTSVVALVACVGMVLIARALPREAARP